MTAAHTFFTSDSFIVCQSSVNYSMFSNRSWHRRLLLLLCFFEISITYFSLYLITMVVLFYDKLYRNPFTWSLYQEARISLMPKHRTYLRVLRFIFYLLLLFIFIGHLCHSRFNRTCTGRFTESVGKCIASCCLVLFIIIK